MTSDELNKIIFADLLLDKDQYIYSKSKKRVKLIIDGMVYILTGSRQEKYYVHIIPMTYQGAKTYDIEWKQGDNILEFIKEYLLDKK
jgi:hypothetical protein